MKIIDENVFVPEGWTYFTHRSNTKRWEGLEFEKVKNITVSKTMSAITEDDVYRDIAHYGREHRPGYTSGDGKPFEIRVLIPKLETLKTIGDPVIERYIYNNFYFDRLNIGGVQGKRHPSIATDEILDILKFGQFDEAYQRNGNILWAVPESYKLFYIGQRNNDFPKDKENQNFIEENEDKNRYVYGLEKDYCLVFQFKNEKAIEPYVAIRDKDGWDPINGDHHLNQVLKKESKNISLDKLFENINHEITNPKQEVSKSNDIEYTIGPSK